MDGQQVNLAVGQSGLPWQVLSAWGNLRASYRGLMASAPSEGKLLFIAMASGLVWFLQTIMLQRISGDTAALAEDQFLGQIGAQFVSALIFRTLMLYLVAGAIGYLCRFAGGTADWAANRAAVFWAFLVAAPAVLVIAGLAAMAAPGLTPGLAMSLNMLDELLLAFVLSIFLAEAHGFRRAWTVFAGIAAGSIVLIALGQAVGHMV